MCFNLDPLSEIPPIYLNGVQISIVEHEKHLFNYAPTNISDRNIIANVCDLYQRSNLSISDFRVCDSQTLDCLHKTYCMHMYGFELWNLNCNYVDELRVAGRKIKRRIYYFNMAQRNQFVDDILSDKTSLIHLLDSNDDEDNKEAHIIKHSPYYGETDFSNLLVEKPGFSILSMNIQSINAKFDEFQSFVSRMNIINPISAICLQECWLGDADNVTMFNLENYEMTFLPKSCCAHGGLIIYVHK